MHTYTEIYTHSCIHAFIFAYMHAFIHTYKQPPIIPQTTDNGKDINRYRNLKKKLLNEPVLYMYVLQHRSCFMNPPPSS